MYSLRNPLLAVLLATLLHPCIAHAAPSGYIDTGEYGQGGGIQLPISGCPGSDATVNISFGAPLKNFAAFALQKGCNCPFGASEYTWAIYSAFQQPGQPAMTWRVGRRYAWSGGNFTPRLIRFYADGQVSVKITGRCYGTCILSPYQTSLSHGFVSASVNNAVGGSSSIFAHAKATDKLSTSLLVLANAINIPPSIGAGLIVDIVAIGFCGYDTTSAPAPWFSTTVGQVLDWQIPLVVEVNTGIVSAMGHTEYGAPSAAGLALLSISTLQATDVP